MNVGGWRDECDLVDCFDEAGIELIIDETIDSYESDGGPGAGLLAGTDGEIVWVTIGETGVDAAVGCGWVEALGCEEDWGRLDADSDDVPDADGRLPRSDGSVVIKYFLLIFTPDLKLFYKYVIWCYLYRIIYIISRAPKKIDSFSLEKFWFRWFEKRNQRKNIDFKSRQRTHRINE